MPGMDRTDLLTRWWSSLDVAGKERAWDCADRNVLDEETRESLLAQGAGLVSLATWQGQEGTWHMPNDVSDFILEQERP